MDVLRRNVGHRYVYNCVYISDTLEILEVLDKFNLDI
jgi:hypothetical protein